LCIIKPQTPTPPDSNPERGETRPSYQLDKGTYPPRLGEGFPKDKKEKTLRELPGTDQTGKKLISGALVPKP